MLNPAYQDTNPAWVVTGFVRLRDCLDAPLGGNEIAHHRPREIMHPMKLYDSPLMVTISGSYQQVALVRV